MSELYNERFPSYGCPSGGLPQFRPIVITVNHPPGTLLPGFSITMYQEAQPILGGLPVDRKLRSTGGTRE